MTENGLFTFTTMNLLQATADATRFQGEHKAPKWKIVTRMPSEGFTNVFSQLLNKIALYSGPLLLLLLLAAISQAMQQTKRNQAEEMVVRQIESNARFVPREFLGLLNKGEFTEVDITDHVQKPMTTMFTDIRSYTKLSESMTAQQVLDFLNNYYGKLDPIITKNDGFIDAFIGDAVMALFPGNPENALNAVIDIRKVLQESMFNTGKESPSRVDSGFGLHCGEVTLGAVGTDHRLQTTAIGDAVNLASRIESSTKLYKVNIIITGAVKNALPAPEKFHMRSIDLVRVKGKQEAVELFEVFDTDPEEIMKAKHTNLGLFTIAMANYRRGEFETAVESFQRLKELCPDDAVLDIFIKRSNTMMRIPPGDSWTGVSTM